MNKELHVLDNWTFLAKKNLNPVGLTHKSLILLTAAKISPSHIHAQNWIARILGSLMSSIEHNIQFYFFLLCGKFIFNLFRNARPLMITFLKKYTDRF